MEFEALHYGEAHSVALVHYDEHTNLLDKIR